MSDPDGTVSNQKTGGMNRRRLLQTVGVGAAGFVGMTGIASAHETKFFGCERVCTGTQGSYAVVAVEDSYECRTMQQASDSPDVPWSWTAYCYEAATDEVVVGLLEENVIEGGTKNEDGTCTLCLNTNDCATTAYDDGSGIVATLNEDSACGVCTGNVEISGSCTTYTEPSDDGNDGSSDDGNSDDSSDDGNSDDESGSDDDSSNDDGSSDDGSGDNDDTTDGDNDDTTDETDGDNDDDGESETDTTRNNSGSDDGYDINGDYSDDRDFTKDYGDISTIELAESRQNGTLETDCEIPDEEKTAMERWFDRDDTPENPNPRTCSPTDGVDENSTAMERWFARLDTPDGPVDAVRSLVESDSGDDS